jgi:hypothetical protein
MAERLRAERPGAESYGLCTNEPVGSSLCVQASFRAFSGFANSLTGLGKLKSA